MSSDEVKLIKRDQRDGEWFNSGGSVGLLSCITSPQSPLIVLSSAAAVYTHAGAHGCLKTHLMARCCARIMHAVPQVKPVSLISLAGITRASPVGCESY